MRALIRLLPLLLGGLFACTSVDTVPLAGARTSTMIGASGGEAVSPDGQFHAVFPAGALSVDTAVTVEQDITAPVTGQVGPTYRLGPSGMRGASPIALMVSVPNARGDDTVVLVRVNGNTSVPVMTSVFDGGTRTVSAQVTELASYAVVARNPRTTCDAADGGMPFENKHIVPCWITEQEPNDTLATAQPTDLPLDEGIDLLGHIDADDDFYSFEVPAGSTGAISGVVHSIIGNYGSCEPGLLVDGELLDAQGNVLTSGWHFAGCVGFNYSDDPGARDLPPGHYTVRLFKAPGGQSLPYRFALYLLGPSNGTVVIGPDGGI